MKRFIYLISPTKIENHKFYNQLNSVLKTNKVKFFQLRLKKTSEKNILKISKKIKKIVKKYNVVFIINDKPLVAKKIDSDGCHIGQKDVDFKKSREILGKNKIIGVTCHNSKKLAIKALRNGANYITFGSFFKTSTKKKVIKANLRTLRWARKKIKIPIVAIGGIDNLNYKKVLINGANFIACSHYIWKNKNFNPLEAINKFRQK